MTSSTVSGRHFTRAILNKTDLLYVSDLYSHFFVRTTMIAVICTDMIIDRSTLPWKYMYNFAKLHYTIS